ncbi:hypothetical protein N7462_002153 [Penicillium macrosclerotiorum]|uniref:uncharacterized protein n=1 Tax=Penicillium macrosclerotiorum TaxID=303699 RepID=UPI002546EC61|nr:uncharacterized protein N7462_002153 [Penicillium macrosclerotiorum]KAJ5692730.1 hypothetical protein N7462_002153 [Penicillium macrosclerotiorum]
MFETPGTVYIWDSATGVCIQTFVTRSCESLIDINFTPDGDSLVSASGRAVQFWDVSTGKCIREFEPHCEEVHDIALSAGASVVAFALKNAIQVWDSSIDENSKEGRHLLALSPDGKTLSSSSWASKIKVWDAMCGSCKRVIEPPAFASTSHLSPNGKTLAVAQDGIHLWDIASGNSEQAFGNFKGGTSLAGFSPDGAIFVAGFFTGKVHLFDVSTRTCTKTFNQGIPAHRFAFSGDGRFFVLASSGGNDPNFRSCQFR